MTVNLSLLRWLASPRWRAALRPLMKGRATIFVLHRLDAPQSGVRGHVLEQLGQAVDLLRDSGACIVPLRQLVAMHRQDSPIKPDCVAITMDDGFADQYTMCKEVFAPRNCPVTCFPVVGFLDGVLWPWDDRLGWAFMQSPCEQVALALDGEVHQCDLRTPISRLAALRRVRNRFKRLNGDLLPDVLNSVATQLHVQIPAAAPAQHLPMTWDQARELEQLGMEFGLHTVSHRIVSQLRPEVVEQELSHCWSRLQGELTRPVPVVSWPTGLPGDFTERDERIAASLGIEAGVSTYGNYARLGRHAGAATYTLARFGLPMSLARVIQQGSWIERGKQLVSGH